MTRRENMLRAVRFDIPDHIPMTFHINEACWHHYPREALLELMDEHPRLFPGAEPGTKTVAPSYSPQCRAGVPYTDDWGCVWETTDDGIMGVVTEHPLENWDGFDDFTPPDPRFRSGYGPRDWNQVADELRKTRSSGGLAIGGLNHGHTFLLLSDLRGYQNLLFDMVDNDPCLARLIGMVEDFNAFVVAKYLEFKVEWMGFAEDLGMQVGPMLSPDLFRRHIKPSYQRLMKPARAAGCIVHMHSDGDIRNLADDLVDGGVEVLNLQDLVNGIDWIAAKFAGRVCIELDIDRQLITPHGTPGQIDALIREEVEKLGSRRGGLMMIYGLYPGVPLENVRALVQAMERYAGHYA